jgi:phage baseplate assembly protein W
MVTVKQATLDPKENLGKDIQMINNDIVINNQNDFATIEFHDNLGQAIKNRLQTILGEMQANVNYGSKLSLLLGRQRNDLLKLEIESEIRFTLLQEPRIDDVTNIEIIYSEEYKDKIDIKLEIQPIDNLEPLNMVYELFL